ncbi:CDP-alcohol phosphatidyltransferase family protein [Microlunatus panaciterrae]|uniref:Phosphatidylinositol phosphate synthase n=1 Tax=Microlunatus panaciterrae TaxID=400768 RepID=A0ABS2RDN1_9ACTN|nr:CDP-alcohol phosphatidyltransferase family protein [Microlunatus panaciterrae]MBM7797099.1 CDP-diacylglycerol--glycerol-3-phosphate 3-phosphatidyltransferase [Microlunatus panaciterrae]
MLERFRGAWAAMLTPVAKLLLRLGISPDLVTLGGTAGVVLAAAICLPQGWLWQGALIITLFVISDSIDGQMAKLSGRQSRWGAFLDSSLDRLGDGAVFAGVALWFAGPGDSVLWAGVALWALVWGQVTPYVKARAESLGYTANGGLAARADRILIILLGLLLGGLGVPYAIEVAVTLLAVASTVTVLQRMLKVRRQATGKDHVEPA